MDVCSCGFETGAMQSCESTRIHGLQRSLGDTAADLARGTVFVDGNHAVGLENLVRSRSSVTATGRVHPVDSQQPNRVKDV